MITEDQLEQLCLEWFQAIGYSYMPGAALAPDGDAPERQDYRQILLNQRLLNSLSRLNPHLPQANLEQVLQTLRQAEFPLAIQNNKAFHQYLLQGVKVEYKNANNESQSDYVQLLDFANFSNNEFLVVNQYTLSGSKGWRRPDIVVFVNGLPLAILELKNPADSQADTTRTEGKDTLHFRPSPARTRVPSI